MTDIRAILLTQVLTVVLAPISVGLTVYLLEHSRAAQPDVQYVSATPDYIVIEPSASFVSKINNDPGLASEFRNELRQIAPVNGAQGACAAWLDGDGWDFNCSQVYRSVCNQVRGMLLEAMAPGHESIQESAARQSLKVLEEFRTELAKVATANQPRAGSVALTVGVLNTGDSNGIVFSAALLRFNNRVMQVSADQYTSISAHGFSEVVFTTAREDSGTFVGTFKEGEEATVKSWSDLVKKGNEIGFELTVNLSGKTGVIKGTVPKEN
jgi:hypothetical protein